MQQYPAVTLSVQLPYALQAVNVGGQTLLSSSHHRTAHLQATNADRAQIMHDLTPWPVTQPCNAHQGEHV